MKFLLTFLTLLSLTLVSANGKVLKVPNDEFAIASINIPDDWDQDDITNGVAGTSPDEAVYLAVVAVGSEKGMDAELEDTFAMLKEHDVELDDASKKENKFKINGLEAKEILYQGKDEDGAAAVSITFVTIKDKVVILTYWVSTADEKKHQEEVGKIVNTLKPTS